MTDTSNPVPGNQTEENRGLYFAQVGRGNFDLFIARHAKSPEIGPIQTVFEQKITDDIERDIRLVGLYACGKLCAAAVGVLTKNKTNDQKSCKLDAIVVDQDIRRQGLAMLTVTKLFKDLLEDDEADISNFISHAVHPATVSLLNKLGFTDPPVVGAPVVGFKLTEDSAQTFSNKLNTNYLDIHNRLKLQCLKCLSGRAGMKPWCGADAPKRKYVAEK
ncbi:MAG: hypothetical protein HQ503_01920 [Rhodospirillales bacterium]|nr:hypothetical protein [Rhodospirillales bacterium]